MLTRPEKESIKRLYLRVASVRSHRNVLPHSRIQPAPVDPALLFDLTNLSVTDYLVDDVSCFDDATPPPVLSKPKKTRKRGRKKKKKKGQGKEKKGQGKGKKKQQKKK